MNDKVFTTHGWLDASLVERRETVTYEDEHIRMVRVDKHIKATGEWVGNDLEGQIKKGKEIAFVQQQL